MNALTLIQATVEPQAPIKNVDDFYSALESRRLRLPAVVHVPTRPAADYNPEFKDGDLLLLPVGHGSPVFRFIFPEDTPYSRLQVLESNHGVRTWVHRGLVRDAKFEAAAKHKDWLQQLVNSMHAEFYDA